MPRDAPERTPSFLAQPKQRHLQFLLAAQFSSVSQKRYEGQTNESDDDKRERTCCWHETQQ